MSGTPLSGRQNASAIHLLHRAGQCADELFALNVGDAQLTPRQFAVLSSVAASEEPSQTTLVELTGIDRSTLADIVRRLVERGLLSRRRTRSDARMYAVRLTQEGSLALAATAPVAEQTENQLLAAVPPAERQIVLRGLKAIVEAHGPISSAKVSARATAAAEQAAAATCKDDA